MMQSTKRSSIYYELLAVCREGGCPICRLGLRASEQYINGVLYEYVNDPDVQAQLIAARGYCNRHAWLLPEGYSRGLGVAILQRAVLYDVLDTLNANSIGEVVRRARHGNRARALASALNPQRVCPACQHQTTVERMAISELLKYSDDVDWAVAFQQSAGLCLPHFRQALT
jgi:hypothetical protein